jgi:hypothetical protein
MSRFILAMSIGGLLWLPVMAGAQTPTAAAPSTSAPGKSSVKVDMVPSLFVMNAHGATLQGQTGVARRAYWYGAAAAPYYRPYGYPGYYPPPYGPYPYHTDGLRSCAVIASAA